MLRLSENTVTLRKEDPMPNISVHGTLSLEEMANLDNDQFGFKYTRIGEDDPRNPEPQINMAEEEIAYLNATMEAYEVVDKYQRFFKSASDVTAITAGTATQINTVVKDVCVKAGLEEYPQINLTNYEGRQARKIAITVANEGFTEAIRRLLEIIGRIIKKIYEFVYEDIEGTIRGAAGVVRRANYVQERAVKALKTGRDFKQEIYLNSKELHRFFNDNGKVYAPADIVRNYEAYNDGLNTKFCSRILESAVNAAILTMERDLSSVGIVKYTQDHAFKSADTALKNFSNNALQGFTHQATDGADVYLTPLPFANAKLKVVMMNEEGYHTGMVADIVVDKVDADGKLLALTPAQIREFCRMIETQMNTGIYRDYKRIKQAILKAGKTLEDTCNLIKREQQNAGAGSVASLSFMRTITTSLVDLTKLLYGYNGAANRRLLSYCEQSVKIWE